MVFWIQDLPFLVIRMIVIVYHGVEKNYLLYFLTVKNFFLVFFEIYFVWHIILDERHRRKIYKKDFDNLKMKKEFAYF